MDGEMSDYVNDPSGIDFNLYEYGGLLSCRCCKKCGLHWKKMDSGKFRLFDNNCRMHECLVNPLAGG